MVCKCGGEGCDLPSIEALVQFRADPPEDAMRAMLTLLTDGAAVADRADPPEDPSPHMAHRTPLPRPPRTPR